MQLTDWMTKLKQARSREEVFSMLDQFRSGEWTDEQRSKIARLYIRLLDNLQSVPEEDVPAGAQDENKNDGPVWYEKM